MLKCNFIGQLLNTLYKTKNVIFITLSIDSYFYVLHLYRTCNIAKWISVASTNASLNYQKNCGILIGNSRFLNKTLLNKSLCLILKRCLFVAKIVETGGSRFERTTPALPFLLKISRFEMTLAWISDIYELFKLITLFTNSIWNSWLHVTKLGA